MDKFISESNSDFYILNELNLGKNRSFGLIHDINKSFLRYIDGILIIINKYHIDYKNVNNNRFPSDPEIKKYVAPLNINNSEEHIRYILKRTIESKSTLIRKTIDDIMNKKYNDVIVKTGEYDYRIDDEPFKLSLYSDFKWFDKFKNKTRLFRLESALAVFGTFLTFNRYPLILINDWDDRDNNEPYQKKIISAINSCIAQFRKENGYNLFRNDKDKSDYDVKGGKIDKNFLLKQQNYVLYINGYSTWVKEVNYPKRNYMYGNEFNLSTNNGEDLKDLYKDVSNKKTNTFFTVPNIQTMCIPFNPRNPTIEIDDNFYNKLYNFEKNRYKKEDNQRKEGE